MGVMLIGTRIQLELWQYGAMLCRDHSCASFLGGSQHRAWGQLAAAAARRRQHVKAGAKPVGKRSTISLLL